MGGKAKQSQRQAYEARAANRGMGLVTVRLSPEANRMLCAICASRNYTPRQVIEGLLLGTTAFTDFALSAEYGVSLEEAAIYRNMPK